MMLVLKSVSKRALNYKRSLKKFYERYERAGRYKKEHEDLQVFFRSLRNRNWSMCQ